MIRTILTHYAFRDQSLPTVALARAHTGSASSELTTLNNWGNDAGIRPAAVLLLLIPPEDPGEPARVVLTRRTKTVGSHKGQIGFPGGRREVGDHGPGETALRETVEEVGVSQASVVLQGILAPIPAIDGSLVYPVVGISDVGAEKFQPSVDEIDSILLTPWPGLARSRAEEFDFVMFGVSRHSLVYETECDAVQIGLGTIRERVRVWGLTASMLWNADLGAGH